MENEPIPGADTASPGDSPGALLRRAREAAGLSQEDVADALRLLRFQVIALEDDRYDQMAGSTFVRGYLRAYARLLEMPQDVVLDAFETLQRQRAPQARPQRKVARRRISGPQRALAGLAVALLAWGLINWLMNAPATPVDPAVAVDDHELSSELDQPAGADVSPGEHGGQGGDGRNGMPAEQQLDDEGMTQLAPAPQHGLSSVAGPDSAAEPPEVGSAGRSGMAPPQPEPAIAPVGPSTATGGLQLRFNGDCWVEVHDASGASLLARLQRAGDAVTLDGQAPYRVFLGNAVAAQVEWNGALVPVNTVAANNTARLIIGRP